MKELPHKKVNIVPPVRSDYMYTTFSLSLTPLFLLPPRLSHFQATGPKMDGIKSKKEQDKCEGQGSNKEAQLI